MNEKLLRLISLIGWFAISKAGKRNHIVLAVTGYGGRSLCGRGLRFICHSEALDNGYPLCKICEAEAVRRYGETLGFQAANRKLEIDKVSVVFQPDNELLNGPLCQLRTLLANEELKTSSPTAV